ncbi:unknown protein [Seminavis robusta]|uniref:Uncharacterized protein n=1 Tax=Seminavis robusta TaxID=568900 RepID=A0A9N8EL62_9STRA|nr:unknown protein [Seminavis robusta]|eukprot:Sro1182_g249950.1 n/a (650) ;mRNA; r:16500-18612
MAPPKLTKEELAQFHLHLEAKSGTQLKDLAKEHPEVYAEEFIGKEKVIAYRNRVNFLRNKKKDDPGDYWKLFAASQKHLLAAANKPKEEQPKKQPSKSSSTTAAKVDESEIEDWEEEDDAEAEEEPPVKDIAVPKKKPPRPSRRRKGASATSTASKTTPTPSTTPKKMAKSKKAKATPSVSTIGSPNPKSINATLQFETLEKAEAFCNACYVVDWHNPENSGAPLFFPYSIPSCETADASQEYEGFRIAMASVMDLRDFNKVTGTTICGGTGIVVRQQVYPTVMLKDYNEIHESRNDANKKAMTCHAKLANAITLDESRLWWYTLFTFADDTVVTANLEDHLAPTTEQTTKITMQEFDLETQVGKKKHKKTQHFSPAYLEFRIVEEDPNASLLKLPSVESEDDDYGDQLKGQKQHPSGIPKAPPKRKPTSPIGDGASMKVQKEQGSNTTAEQIRTKKALLEQKKKEIAERKMLRALAAERQRQEQMEQQRRLQEEAQAMQQAAAAAAAANAAVVPAFLPESKQKAKESSASTRRREIASSPRSNEYHNEVPKDGAPKRSKEMMTVKGVDTGAIKINRQSQSDSRRQQKKDAKKKQNRDAFASELTIQPPPPTPDAEKTKDDVNDFISNLTDGQDKFEQEVLNGMKNLNC